MSGGFLSEISKEQFIYSCLVQAIDDWSASYFKSWALIEQRGHVQDVYADDEDMKDIANLPVNEIENLQGKIGEMNLSEVNDLQNALLQLAFLSDYI